MATTSVTTDRPNTAIQLYTDAVFIRDGFKQYFGDDGDLSMMESDGRFLLGTLNSKALSDVDPTVSGALFYKSDAILGAYVLCVSSGN